MKRLITSFAVLALAGVANAAVTAYEPFNYALGTFANNTPATGAGFANNWTVANTPSIVAGMTYPDLPTTANAYQHSATASRTSVGFAANLSSGTAYVSFLFKGSGNSGGDTVGVFLKGDNSTSLFAGFRTPNSASLTGFGLGSVSSTALSGATALGAAINISNTATNFIVLRIDFNTSGANDTVGLWINPPAGTNAPSAAANVTYSAFDVGNISGFGFNIQGGYNPKMDEFRTGATYGDVVGYNAAPATGTNQTTLAISSAIGKQVSWTAYSTNNYQPQKSTDNNTWVDLGSAITGATTTNVYDAAFAPYYRILELTFGGAGPDQIGNGSFEIPAGNNSGAANWTSGANTTYESIWVTNQWGSLTPVSGTNLLFMEGTTAAVSPAAPNASLLSDWFPVVGGLSYNVKFNAANPVKIGGANPQFRVRFYNAGNGFISEEWRSFASAGNTWTLFSVTNTAPANAAFMELFFIQAVGAGASWDWVTLIDDVSVNATTTLGATNVLPATVRSGVSFTATVKTNGVTATDATGTIAFQTNSVGLSTNGISVGSASSGNAILLPTYTVTAIYSGDGNYTGSTNTLTVDSTAVAVTLGNLSHTYDGTAKSASATTAPSGFTVALTYDGSPVAPTDAGTYQVIGVVVDDDYQGSATNNLVIDKAAATVTLDNLNQTYDGTARNVTATTVPNGLTVTFTYDGSPNAPTNVGTYQVIGTVVDLNYLGSATNNLVVTSGISNAPTNITSSIAGNQLTISWPEDHLGWVLQSQTNSLDVGVANNWSDVSGSETGTQSVITIDPQNPAVFFRLRSP